MIPGDNPRSGTCLHSTISGERGNYRHPNQGVRGPESADPHHGLRHPYCGRRGILQGFRSNKSRHRDHGLQRGWLDMRKLSRDRGIH